MLFEVLVAQRLARCHTHVAAGVQRPGLGFDFFEGGGFAEPWNVFVFWIFDCRFPIRVGATSKNLQKLSLSFATPKCEIGRFPSIEANDVGQKTDLCFGPVAVGAVDLAVYVARVDEEHGVHTIG